nr:hypothetical protein [Hyphomonas sp. Mor2]
MANKIKNIVTKSLLMGALLSGVAGTASAGACVSSVKYDGPSSKIFIYIKNETSSPSLAIIGRAKNTDDIRDENDSYKELDRYTVPPGDEYMMKDSTSENANKVYSVHMLSIYNMFRISNDSGYTSGTSRYQGKSENMEYKDYNDTASNPYEISCNRDYTSAAKWKITFKVKDR